ncbi:MAG: hypothetical protein AB7E42_03330 [Anaerotignaceae bacterium]
MNADEVVKALRCEENLGSEACKECVYGQKESLCFCLDSEAADLLERLQAKLEAITKDRDQWRAVAEAGRDVIQPKLRAEIEELKASQPVRCKDCVKRKTEDCSMYYECECGEQHTWEVDDDYCSLGERRVEK